MNWRYLTIVNAAIALITVSAVIFDVTRSRPHSGAAEVAEKSNGANNPSVAAKRRANPLEDVESVLDIRVDDLGAVASSELSQIMGRAKPGELSALALKFNDLPVDAHTLGGLGVFFQAWTELDPKGALIGAFRLKDVTLRKLAARVVVNSISPSAAPDLAGYLMEHPDKDLMAESKGEYLGALIGNWAYLNPEDASKFLDSLGEAGRDLDYDARSKIAYAWGTLDPDAALDWIAKHSSDGSYDPEGLYDDAIRGWCDKNLAAASSYVEQHTGDQGAERAASSVAAALFTRDVNSATSWASRLPLGDARDGAEITIARTWAQQDPAAASRWAATLSQSEQANVVRSIVGNWMNKDWPATSAYLATLTGGPRDQALAVAANRDDAATTDSLALAMQINDTELRARAVGELVRSWASNDGAAAETWIRNSSLTSEEQAKFISEITEMLKAENQAEVESVIVR